jgi:hypothetical protein
MSLNERRTRNAPEAMAPPFDAAETYPGGDLRLTLSMFSQVIFTVATQSVAAR